MVVFTIGGVIAAVLGAVSVVVSAGGFLVNILTLPFKVAGDNKLFATSIYWFVFVIDSFLIVNLTSAFTNPIFELVGYGFI